MNIPFLDHIKVELDLTLKNRVEIQNHIGSLHAGAIFTLAESASGFYLQNEFNDSNQEVLPLLRESSIKYKKAIFDKASVRVVGDKEANMRFLNQFLKKGYGTIKIAVEIVDEEKNLCAIAEFKWFIQSTL